MTSRCGAPTIAAGGTSGARQSGFRIREEPKVVTEQPNAKSDDDNAQPTAQKPAAGTLRGKGYVAGRRFQDAERSFSAKGSLVGRKARNAAADEAFDRPKGAGLGRARRETGQGKTLSPPPAHRGGHASAPHVEANIDQRRHATLPAADPR